MAILLKNLVARTPQTRDLSALADLLRMNEEHTEGEAQNILADLRTRWLRSDVSLARDAWVIETTTGQLAGFACVWREEAAHLSLFLCVHPAYRGRGVGTLLLRMVEARAREQARPALFTQHVTLRCALDIANIDAQRLFEHEGYQAGRSFLRLSFTQYAEGEPFVPRQRIIELGLEEQKRTFDPAAFNEQDGLCRVHLYRIYEKELRPARIHASKEQDDLQALSA